MSDYRVALEVYNGPLDLLLYLILRDEVDIYDIPIALITARFIEHVELLQRIDPDAIGDFLVMAATLMEIKSRTLLPHPPEAEADDDFDDPRMELVQQLLEYKKFKDAARGLGLVAELRALKHPRFPASPPTEAKALDIEHVQLWDLVEAFRKLLADTGHRRLSLDVVYDDTPIALHATDVLDSLERAGGLQLFEAIFAGRGKSQLIGLFLALLELIRRKRIRAFQEVPFGPISIQLLDATPIRVEEEPMAEANEVGPMQNTSDAFAPAVEDPTIASFDGFEGDSQIQEGRSKGAEIVTDGNAYEVSPDGADYASPGQRPGEPSRDSLQALKGRTNRSRSTSVDPPQPTRSESLEDSS